MTKDGRPSLLNDIRLFAGESSFRNSYLQGLEEAVAYGRRMAWFLNGEGVSVGAFPALYVLFTSLLTPGSVQVTNDGGEWWQRYVHVGVTEDFPNVSNVLEVIMQGIVHALLALRPDQADTILHADTVVREHQDGLRFLIRRRETRKIVTEISFSIEAWPKPSYMFIAYTDKTTGTYSEADPIALDWYMEAFSALSRIRLLDAVNLTERQRPAMSKVVKRHG
jgi:hypothetical protein